MTNLEAIPFNGLLFAPTIMALLGIALLAVRSEGKVFPSARWFAAAFCCVAFSLGIDAAMDHGTSQAQHILGDLILLPAGFFAARGLATHLEFRFSATPALLMCGLGAAGYIYFRYVFPAIEWRALSVLLGVAFTIMFALPAARRSPGYPAEKALVVSLAAFAILLAILSAAMFSLAGHGLTAEQFNFSVPVLLIKLLTVASALMIYLALMRSYIRNVVANFSRQQTSDHQAR